jgi:hydroxymethylpyrimidine kinase/phosphomethylpyrimidine kinase
MHTALTVAGSDSIGGAGIQADLRAFASLGVHGANVITAITSQNSQRVTAIHPVPVPHVRSQLEAVLEDADVKAAKTGMLYSAAIVHAVSEKLRRRDFPLVVDPVLVAGVGDALHSEDLVDALRSELLRIADLVTPNRFEAEMLSGIRIGDEEDIIQACRSIGSDSTSVLIKGGHMDTERVVDILYHRGEVIRLEYPRLPPAGHGGGCTLSSYIAALLSKGMEMPEAVGEGRELVQESIRSMYQVGKGVDLVDPMATWRMEAERYNVIHFLTMGVRRLEGILPGDWVPEVGMNFVYALPKARGPRDVAALEGRITSVLGEPRHIGCISFGASSHVAAIVLAAMEHDPTVRSVVNIRFSEERVKRFGDAGLSVGGFDRTEEPEGRRSMEWGTDHAIRELGKVPDIIFDRGGVRKEPMIRLLGKNPQDIINKLELAL